MFLSRVIIFQGWICAYTTQSGESCRLDESVLLNSDLVAREVRRIADGPSIQRPGDSINRLCCHSRRSQGRTRSTRKQTEQRRTGSSDRTN